MRVILANELAANQKPRGGSRAGSDPFPPRPIEINLETLDAGAMLDQIEAGRAPRELLPFIPMMKRGEEDGIIQRWRQLVHAETDLHRRSGYALTRLFAERVGRLNAWQNALEGFSMIESPIIAELLANTTTKAEAEGKADSLLRVLRNWSRRRGRFKS